MRGGKGKIANNFIRQKYEITHHFAHFSDAQLLDQTLKSGDHKLRLISEIL